MSGFFYLYCDFLIKKHPDLLCSTQIYCINIVQVRNDLMVLSLCMNKIWTTNWNVQGVM